MCFEFCTNQNILVTMLRIDQENGGKNIWEKSQRMFINSSERYNGLVF